MRVRSALRVGDELQGSWWGVPRTFTVLGGMFLRRCGGGENSSRRYDQWRLVNEVDTEFWVEIDRNTSKVFFCETVILAENIDPRQVGVGQVFLLEVEGSKCSAAVVEVGEAMLEDVIGTPGNTLGAGARTSWAELEVKDAAGNVSVVVVDEHRRRSQQTLRKMELSPSQQKQVFGRKMYRKWWGSPPGLNRKAFIGFLKVVLIVLVFVALVVLEYVTDSDDDFDIGGSSYRNRSVYGGGGGGVGK